MRLESSDECSTADVSTEKEEPTVESKSSGCVSSPGQLPYAGKVLSICQELGMAFVFDQKDNHWALVKDDFPKEFWSSLRIGTPIFFSDNGFGCVVKARISDQATNKCL